MPYNKIVIENKLRAFLEEDCNFKDVSSEFIPKKEFVSAKIIAKGNGYVAGLSELKVLYIDILGVNVTLFKNDGETIKPGDIIAEIKGNAHQVLLGERVGLNLMMLMSSITTTTRKYVEMMEKSGKRVKIASTRKTTPGIRIFEKRAVELGGGDPHRFSLDDMILLKDTHLKYYSGDVKKLLEDVKEKASFSKKIELEVEKPEDAVIAAENGVDIVMLDNMTPSEVENTVRLLVEKDLRKTVLIEVSGGISLENLAAYIDTEPDIISTSALIQYPSEKVDLTLRFS